MKQLVTTNAKDANARIVKSVDLPSMDALKLVPNIIFGSFQDERMISSKLAGHVVIATNVITAGVSFYLASIGYNPLGR